MFLIRGVLFTFILLSTALVNASEQLTLLNWEDYLAQPVIERWEKQTGVRIEQIYFDNDKERDRILASPERANIDIAVVDEVASRQFGDKGHFILPTQDSIPNMQHIPQRWQRMCGAYSVPYFWGTLGIAYRTDKFSTPPSSWLDLLEPPAELRRHISMLDDPVDMLIPSLVLQDRSISTSDQQALKKAFIDLKRQADSVLTYQYPITFLQHDTAADQLYMAMVYSGDQFTMSEISGVANRWKYVVPKEGTLLWMDCLTVLSTTDKSELAHQFLNFLQQPEIAALNAQSLYFATPNKAAFEQLDERQKQDKSLYPPESTLRTSQQYQTLDMKNMQRRNRITHSVRKFNSSL